MEHGSVQKLETVPNPIVPQMALDKDGWEPPFERWLRIADAVLANASFTNSEPLPQRNNI